MLFAVIGLCVVLASAVVGGIYLASALLERIDSLEEDAEAVAISIDDLSGRVDSLERTRRPGRPRKPPTSEQEAA